MLSRTSEYRRVSSCFAQPAAEIDSRSNAPLSDRRSNKHARALYHNHEETQRIDRAVACEPVDNSEQVQLNALLDLGHAAIDTQVDTGDETAIIRSEEGGCLRNFIGIAHASEGDA